MLTAALETQPLVLLNKGTPLRYIGKQSTSTHKGPVTPSNSNKEATYGVEDVSDGRQALVHLAVCTMFDNIQLWYSRGPHALTRAVVGARKHVRVYARRVEVAQRHPHFRAALNRTSRDHQL